ncbi:MAG: histidine phosphatase family protein [candidate division SR1 bacterium]|nr:histidine phosphatase family protein [candidate division SR1 bacterium]
MIKIYLARHGQDKDNEMGILNGHRDMPLTEIGLDQAKQVAQKIKDSKIHFDKIYSSPLQRAYQTAKIISDYLQVDAPEKNELLIERDFGIMTGKPTKDSKKLCSPDIIQAELITYFLSPEGAETFPQLIIRAKKLLDFIKSKHDGQSILMVTHGDFGKMIYAAYYNLDWQEVLTMFHFGNSELLLLSDDSSAEDSHIFNIKQHNS